MYIIGLSIEYKNSNNEIGQWLNWIFALPLLNLEELSESFIEDFMSVVPDDSRLKKFRYYICDNYIDGASKFNPKMWASSSISSERTNFFLIKKIQTDTNIINEGLIIIK